jgi:hypothetical protein
MSQYDGAIPGSSKSIERDIRRLGINGPGRNIPGESDSGSDLEYHLGLVGSPRADQDSSDDEFEDARYGVMKQEIHRVYILTHLSSQENFKHRSKR